MKKILLIGAETREVESLAERLRADDAQVRVAPGGLYALTMLERERPHLILTIAELGDMSGIELSTMVKRDFSMSDVQIVLLARTLEEKLLGERQGEFDLILLDDRPLDAMARRLGRLIRRGLLPESPTPPELQDPGHVLTGSLGVLSFAELTQALSHTSKTGKLTLDVKGGRGVVFFADGIIQHAAFRDAVGQAAFSWLFYETERTTHTSFRFEPLSAHQMLRQSKTIDQSAQQLLLAAAVDLDENTTTELVTAGLKKWLREEESADG